MPGCSDNSTCVVDGCDGYGGDGSTASANSPLPGLRIGMKQYASQGVPMDKIVLGLPCDRSRMLLALTSSTVVCAHAAVRFASMRGANTSVPYLSWYGYDYACSTPQMGTVCSTGCQGKSNSHCSGPG